MICLYVFNPITVLILWLLRLSAPVKKGKILFRLTHIKRSKDIPTMRKHPSLFTIFLIISPLLTLRVNYIHSTVYALKFQFVGLSFRNCSIYK